MNPDIHARSPRPGAQGPRRWPVPIPWWARCWCATAKWWAAAFTPRPACSTPKSSRWTEAGEQARGATLYINLEPCAHQGRTPPCADALIAAGVARVVGADAKTPIRWWPARASVSCARRASRCEIAREFAAEAAKLNEPFLHFMRTGRPLVTLKTAITLDGKISAPDDNRGWITSERARAHVRPRGTSYWYEFSMVAGGNSAIISDAKNWPPMQGKSLSGYQQKKVWLNDGAGHFTEVAQAVGYTDTHDGRGVALVDLWNRGVAGRPGRQPARSAPGLQEHGPAGQRLGRFRAARDPVQPQRHRRPGPALLERSGAVPGGLRRLRLLGPEPAPPALRPGQGASDREGRHPLALRVGPNHRVPAAGRVHQLEEPR